MNRQSPLLLFAALLLAACGPSPQKELKVDPSAEAWYAPAVERLTTIDRNAEQLFQNGMKDQAAAMIASGQSLQGRLLTASHPTLPAMEAIADFDQIYGKMLVSNGYFGEARLLFQKNVTRWKTWKPQTPETEARRKKATDAIAECDRHMGA